MCCGLTAFFPEQPWIQLVSLFVVLSLLLYMNHGMYVSHIFAKSVADARFQEAMLDQLGQPLAFCYSLLGIDRCQWRVLYAWSLWGS